MAFTPPYSVTVPVADTDRDAGQTEITKWTTVRNFINDASPVIATGMAGPAGATGPAGPAGATGPAGPPGGLTGGVFSFTFSNTITAPPSVQQLRFNNATQNSATQIFVSETDTDGLDVTIGLGRIQVGWKIYVQDFDNAANSITYTVTSATDSGTYWTFGVTLASATGTNPIPAGKVALQYISPATVGMPSGGTTGQSLTKASNTSFDTVWATVTGGGSGVSVQAGNILTNGSDGKAFFTSAPITGTGTTTRQLTAPVTDIFANITVVDDSSDPNTWIERQTFWFDSGGFRHRTGYFNEYGEIRSVAGRGNTVAARFFAKENLSDPITRSTTVPIFEVCDDRTNRNRLFSVTSTGSGGASQTLVNFGNPAGTLPSETFHVTGSARITGTIAASNIDKKISSGTTAPSSPAVGDVWVDTN